MITRKEILKSPEYWFEEAQNELYRQLTAYMQREKITQTELAEKLGVTKGYVSQILNGNFNYTLKKLIELSLSIDLAPTINYHPVEAIIAREANVNSFSLITTKTTQVSMAASADSQNSGEATDKIFSIAEIKMKVA
ncbi:MAG: helix-turn-helix transcriptional regulator [Bacteroidota bacterium]